MGGREPGRELVVVALPGVRDFIAEAQSTSDVHASSDIYASLADRVVDAGGELVLPVRDSAGTVDAGQAVDAKQPVRGRSGGSAGTPNRIVALFSAGSGAVAAGRARRAADGAWEGWVRCALGLSKGDPVPATPGFPLVQWVCVPEGAGEYAGQWREAQRLLAARPRIRDFAVVQEQGWRQRKLCWLPPRWAAEPEAPDGVPPHERSAVLSVAGWVKRRWRRLSDSPGFRPLRRSRRRLIAWWC
jgi:CRISPR-associated protein Cmr2